ncbi:alpha/beta hydrolase [Curtobacterium sp. RRHDQ10]|uniref:alpha/beta hydrolase n=1 Tax=Curtobacterium phyllosphaerae TaxID=3413379 RepID=UPI003BF07255
MIHWLFGTRLEVPTKLVPADVVFAVLVLLAVLLPLRRRPGRQLPLRPGARRRSVLVSGVVIAAGALVGLLACWVVGDLANAFDTHLTTVTRMWVAFAFAGVALGVLRVVTGPGVVPRVIGGVLMVVALVVSGLGINVDYAAYPTINALLQKNPYPDLHLGAEQAADPTARVVSGTDWHPPTTMPRKGVVGSVEIPGRESGFPARPAVVYLPPAARTAHPPVLPVIISLSGQPGTPSDMFAVGHLPEVLDAYAAQHGGLAPIVVAADQLAVPGHNPMCVDSSVGRSGTYITQDVPAWITAHLNVPTPGRNWGLVGFSQGATCTMQFLAGHPDEFAAGLAISSQLAPIDRTPQNSADEAFGGSLRRWRAAAPGALLKAHGPYRDHMLILTSGQNDDEFTRNARALERDARGAGIRVQRAEAPGSGHDWNTVFWSLQHELPAIADFLGTPASAPASGVSHGGTAAQGVVDLASSWVPPDGLPKAGRLLHEDIPGTVSHFAARPGLVWLPPAALVAHPPRLPVVVLLSGQSRDAGPDDLERLGHLDTTMNEIAALGRGLAPIVVVPDQLGQSDHNPMCVDGALGNSLTYLTRDVPAWVAAHYAVQTDPAAWTIGGFSQGGTCAIQIGAGHPERFEHLIDVSGERAPSLGTVATTIRDGFGGSRVRYEAAIPANELHAHAPYAHSDAYFAVGQDDARYGAATPEVASAATKAGMHVTTWVVPGGGHSWGTAAPALAAGMQWLLPKIGLRVG